MISIKLLTVLIFVVTYVFIIYFYHHKTWIVIGAVILLLGLKFLSPMAAYRAINWNVIFLYFGMLLVSETFLRSRLPDYFATHLTANAKKGSMAMLIICAFTGLLSIFLENVAVVLLVAPIALSIAKKSRLNPVPLFIGMAISSNLQGAATLIGDPPSMLLAGFANMDFNDFFMILGKPGIFFAVQCGALCSWFFLYFIFKKYCKPLPEIEQEKFTSIIPGVLVVLLIIALIGSASFKHSVHYITGLLCLVFGAICFLWHLMFTKGRDVKEYMQALDWQTGLFLMGIFILVESLSAAGILKDLADMILSVGGSNQFVLFMLIVWLSVLISAFVDNVPYLVAMLPVVQIITTTTGFSPYLFYFGLLIGASVGGNITPIGASANIVAMGIMKKHHHNVSFFEFVKIGLPFTLIAVSASAAFLWIIFA